MATENKGRFHSGTRFRGNVNGAEMEIISVEEGLAKIRDIKTGNVFIYGVQALEHCDLEVTGWQLKSG